MSQAADRPAAERSAESGAAEGRARKSRRPDDETRTYSGGGLLEATIVLTLSVGIVIFVVTFAGKFLGDENFERLPDFIRNSYAALYSLLTAGGLAGLLSLIQSRRGTTTSTLRYLLYILGCSSFVLACIAAAVVLAPNPLERTLQPPPLSTRIDLTSATPVSKSFTLTTASTPGFRMELTGQVSYSRDRITGHIERGSITLVPLPGYPVPAGLTVDSVAINVCHYFMANGQPVLRFDPDGIVKQNYAAVHFDLSQSPNQTFAVEPFDFDFATPSVDFAKLAWLCGSFSNGNRSFLAVVQ
jgi:hypothetical protein